MNNDPDHNATKAIPAEDPARTTHDVGLFLINKFKKWNAFSDFFKTVALNQGHPLQEQGGAGSNRDGSSQSDVPNAENLFDRLPNETLLEILQGTGGAFPNLRGVSQRF